MLPVSHARRGSALWSLLFLISGPGRLFENVGRPRFTDAASAAIICMMTQVRNHVPATPRHAAACCGPVDDLLNPILFKALCDPTRVKLLGCLIKCGRACAVSEIAECCAVDLSVVSRHLQILERAGVLEASKSGRVVTYIARYRNLSDMFHGLAVAIEQCCPTAPPVRAGKGRRRARE